MAAEGGNAQASQKLKEDPAPAHITEGIAVVLVVLFLRADDLGRPPLEKQQTRDLA